jgi:hypothetical protein
LLSGYLFEDEHEDDDEDEDSRCPIVLVLVLVLGCFSIIQSSLPSLNKRTAKTLNPKP